METTYEVSQKEDWKCLRVIKYEDKAIRMSKAAMITKERACARAYAHVANGGMSIQTFVCR